MTCLKTGYQLIGNLMLLAPRIKLKSILKSTFIFSIIEVL